MWRPHAFHGQYKVFPNWKRKWDRLVGNSVANYTVFFKTHIAHRHEPYFFSFLYFRSQIKKLKQYLKCVWLSLHTRQQWPINIAYRQILCQICLPPICGTTPFMMTYPIIEGRNLSKVVSSSDPLCHICRCLHLNIQNVAVAHCHCDTVPSSHWFHKRKKWFPTY